MKLRSSMSFIIPLLLLVIIISFLVALFALDNPGTVQLRYHIPYILKIPQEADYAEVHLVSVILFSILIGVALMTIFVTIAGIGWRIYMFKGWLDRGRLEKRKMWRLREQAMALGLMGFHQEAIEQFDHLIDKKNPLNELYIGLAETFERAGDEQKAIENYNSVLTRDSDNMRALYGAARNWEALGNYDEAIKLYDRVLAVDRTSPTAVQKRQELLEQSGRFSEAIEMYQRSKSPHDVQKTQEILASLYYRLAVQQVKQGDLKAGERTLKEGRREYDFYVPSMLILGNLYMNTGRERDAERLWEATAEHTLSTIILRRLEEYYYQLEGKPEENLEAVIDLYKKLIEAEPEANHLRLALGKLYLKLEKFEEAEQFLLDVQRKDPSIPQVHLLLSDLYHRTEKIDKALEEYRISAELVDIKIADFKCLNCGAMYEYWADQCTSCKSWGTIEDLFYKRGPKSVIPELKQKPLPQLPTASAEDTEEKVISMSK